VRVGRKQPFGTPAAIVAISVIARLSGDTTDT